MERFLLGKEKGEQIWRSMKDGPHVLVRKMVRDVTTTLMGQEEQRPTPLTTTYIEKLNADEVAFSEMVFGVPPSLFEHIKIFGTLFKICLVVNEFDTFTTTLGESVSSTYNRYINIVNNMIAYRIVQTSLEYNLKFINSLGKGWGNIKLFLQRHESNVAQTLRELSGGPLALVSSFDPQVSNPSVSNPFKVFIPPITSVQPTPPALHLPTNSNYQFDGDLDLEAMDSELRFQQEFALLSMKYKRPWNPTHKPYHNGFQAFTRIILNHFLNLQRTHLLTNPTSRHQESYDNMKSYTPKIVCHKCGHGNHFGKDYMAKAIQKPKIKDSAYYACRAQEMAASEKVFITTVTRDVEGYWSSGDEDEVSTGRSMCLMARKMIECDEGYWSSGSEEDDEDAEPNFCYMATNDPPGKSIV
uniref:Uncharacterized protein n=1 Tax=Lactuca sativa TaxID=4236 RepID=A0A9R1V072_LACSA|nr:hypothetical protein LSAT_V11C700370380 [Lactuca sativa]